VLNQRQHLPLEHLHELTQIHRILVGTGLFRVFPAQVKVSNAAWVEDGGNLVALQRRQHLLSVHVNDDGGLIVSVSHDIRELVCLPVVDVLHQVRYTTRDTEARARRITRLQKEVLDLALGDCTVDNTTSATPCSS